MSLNATVARVTQRIVERSKPVRRGYLERMRKARDEGTSRAPPSSTPAPLSATR